MGEPLWLGLSYQGVVWPCPKCLFLPVSLHLTVFHLFYKSFSFPLNWTKMYQCRLKEKESKYIRKTLHHDANVRLVQIGKETKYGSSYLDIRDGYFSFHSYYLTDCFNITIFFSARRVSKISGVWNKRVNKFSNIIVGCNSREKKY